MFTIFMLTISAALQADDVRPNIVFILADDLGYGDVSFLNPDSKTDTPNIDRLAKGGLSFTDAHAPGSVCVPSRYGLLTGRYPFRTWTSDGEKKRERHGRVVSHFRAPMLIHDPKRLNLASLMKRNGYATACFGKWHQGLNWREAENGTLQTTPVDFGFDTYFGFDAPEQGPYAFIHNKRFVSPLTREITEQLGIDVKNPKAQGAHWYRGPASETWDFETCLPRLATKADDWIRQHAAKSQPQPFFIYHSIPAPHAPWLPVPQFKGKSGAGQYGDYVMTVDAIVGQFLEMLEKHRLAENTLVIFSSDNGPVWYAEDVERFRHKAVGHLRGMKGALHEGGHRMPFFVRWPGHTPRGASCDELICFTDMMATFAAIVGDELPADVAEDSMNILPLLEGKQTIAPIRANMIHPNWGSYTLAIRQGDWKLVLPEWVYTVKDQEIVPDQVVATDGKGSQNNFQLYNLRSDPSEKTNLAAEHMDTVRELFAALKADIRRGRSRP